MPEMFISRRADELTDTTQTGVDGAYASATIDVVLAWAAGILGGLVVVELIIAVVLP